MKKTLFLLFLVQVLTAQNIPFVVDHPVYNFLERQESRGHIQAEYWSTRPFTYTQINEMLNEVSSHGKLLSSNDRKILARFQHEFNRELEDDGISFPWSKSTLNGLRHPEAGTVKPFLMTYKQGETKGWINWSETFRIQNNGEASRGYYTDHLGIYGVKGRIAFTTQYTYHRVTKSDEFDNLPDTYKEGYILDRDYIKWITWDYPNSSLTYTHPDFTLGIHRQPIYWGYSANNSPILSDNVNPLPHIQWTTETAHIRYKFIHARLSPNESPVTDTLNTRRNLSSHRVEFDISPNFEFAFNELIVYAHRDFELGYLNPVNFLFAEEHVQGDLDNLLMALEFKWRARPGFTTYGTWFFDELDFFKLFSGWWGNKFVFQLGATYYPKSNLPSLNIEYTAARPWTYSHSYPVNSFTSAGRVIGLKAGPNSKMWHMGLDWQLSPKLYVRGWSDFYSQGDDLGSNPLNSYTERGNFAQEDQQFLTGELHYWSNWALSCEYSITRTTIISMAVLDDNRFEFGLKFDF